MTKLGISDCNPSIISRAVSLNILHNCLNNAQLIIDSTICQNVLFLKRYSANGVSFNSFSKS